MSRRRNGAGLFNGFWTDLEGTKIRRIFRSEYGELYRLHRLCSEQEASAPGQGAFRRWLPVESGYAEISFPGVPRFVEALSEGSLSDGGGVAKDPGESELLPSESAERWQEEPTKAPNPCAAAVPSDWAAPQQTALPASAWEAA